MNDVFNLKNKVVGLTGGGGHLGSALAVGLAAAGATTLIFGRSPDKLDAVKALAGTKSLPGRVYPYVLDVTDEKSIADVLSKVEHQHGVPHGWINNAADVVPELTGSLSSAGVNATLTGTLTQVILLSDRVGAMMAQARRGSIVNIASMYGLVSPQPAAYAQHPRYHNPPAYGAAKAGIIQYTRYAACHLAQSNVRVNCLSPGPFPNSTVAADDSFVSQLAQRTPMARIGQPDELIGPVIFLLSDAASYITGQNIAVDGGWTAW